MTMVKWLIAVVAVSGLGLVGCGDDDGTSGTPDSGPMPMVDGGGGGENDRGFGPICRRTPPETECPGGAPVLPEGATPLAQQAECATADDCIDLEDPTLINAAMAMPADYSCLGMRTAPMRGADVSFTLEINDFQEDTDTPDVCVEVYGDNLVPTGDDTCMGMTTNAMGTLMAMAGEGGWYAYRVFPRIEATPADTVVGSIQYNEVAPAAGGTAQGISISGATISLIPTVLGFPRARMTAILAGTVTDCADNPVYGARIEIILADGTRVVEGETTSDPHYRYFDGDSFPSSRQPWTHIDGLYAVANLAPVTEPARVEVWGRLTADAPMELIGCETGVLLSDTGTILNIGPLRMDAPAGCGE